MNINFKKILVLFLFLGPIPLFADHPSEGQATISILTKEALQNNLELRSALEDLKESELAGKASKSGFYPQVSLEGGPQISQIAGERKSGVALYGKVDWNIYRGGQDIVKSKLAKEQLDLSKRQKDFFEREVKTKVAQLYYELQFASESSTLIEEAIQLNERQKKIAVKKNQAGFTAGSDLLEFELREATLKSDLLFANQEITEASRQLNVLLSRPNESDILTVKGHLERKVLRADRPKLRGAMLQNNFDLISVASEYKVASLTKQKIESGFKPQINVEGLYGRIGNEEEIYQGKNNLALLLKVSVPLFSGFEAFYSAKAAQARMESTSSKGEQRRIELLGELDATYSRIETLGKRLDLEEANLARSMKYFESTFNEYKLGQKNSPDMVGASERVVDARLRNLEYRRDCLIEIAKLSNLVGSDLSEI